MCRCSFSCSSIVQAVPGTDGVLLNPKLNPSSYRKCSKANRPFPRCYKNILYEDSTFTTMWGFLYKRFELDWFWWQFVIICQKFALILVKTFGAGDVSLQAPLQALSAPATPNPNP